MKTLRILYHMARADFLERIRRYNFLIILALVVYLGFLVNTGELSLRLVPNYRGEINSAWVGTMMSLVVNFYLGLFGFYLVNNCISRDIQTGVGQIIATTPLSKAAYLFGKWLSNVLVLGVMLLVLALAALLMQLLRAEVTQVDAWALLAPFLFASLPVLMLVSAVAILFESMDWLRGGLGNVAYIVVWMISIISEIENSSASLPGPLGFDLYRSSLTAAAQAKYPEFAGGMALSITPGLKYLTFPWEGLHWTPEIALQRLVWVVLALGMLLLAAVFFNRFNPAREIRKRKQADKKSAGQPVLSVDAVPVASVHLTPLGAPQKRFRFGALFMAELRLLLKGQRWWWYAVAGGLVIGQLSSPLETTRILLALGWVWPVLILSGLGSREARFDTRQIVFSAPRPVLNQLPAAWLAAFILVVVMGAGAGLRFAFAGEFNSLLAWLAGALFIPSLALVLGVFTGSGKTFEVIYVIWMYIILNKVPSSDFVGLTPQSPWYVFAPLALGLLLVAALVRQRQVTGR